MAFEQATIKVEKAEEFAKLQAAVERAFLPDTAGKFLKLLDRKGIRVRDFDAVLTARLLEAVIGQAKTGQVKTGESGLNAQHLYKSLPEPDQAQMRELYLSKLETVDQALRHKFKKLYQYY